MTKIETLVKKCLDMYFKESVVKINYRPNWLKNTTGRNMEIDFYYPDLKFGLNINGLHNKKLDKQKERDLLKNKLCEENGVFLVNIVHPA